MNEINVSKFTLKSGKEIYFREPSIGDTEEAAKIVGKKASPDNQIHTGILLQKEMLKRLLVKIADHELSMIEKETLDNFLTFKEYNQALKAVRLVLGEDEGNETMTPEFVTIGGK